MKVSMIVARGKHNQIGKDNKLLWSIKDDMKNFKNLTTGHHILMGRKTFESIGKALPNRTNMVITRNTNFVAPKDVLVFDCSYKAMDFAKSKGENEIFVCGGYTIYKFFLENNLLDRIYLTEVDYDGDADTFVPEINVNEWKVTELLKFEKSDVNEYSGRILCLDKK
ncbi:MAG: dihydrofolate reductase [Rickettsiales bacterium]|nr:dihydrofolate reductase [Rickettsiales bacterium]